MPDDLSFLDKHIKPPSKSSQSALTQDELEDTLRRAGWDEKHIPRMSAIGMAESSRDKQGRAVVNSYNPGIGKGGKATVEESIGNWQINMHPSLGRTYDRKRLASDPLYNAKAALDIFKQQGFNAWGAYTDGRYKSFLRKGASPTNLSFLDKHIGNGNTSVTPLSFLDKHIQPASSPTFPTNAPIPSPPPAGALTGGGYQSRPVSQQAITETDDTIQSQINSALDDKVKTRYGVLTTDPEQNGQLFNAGFKAFPVGNEMLWLNVPKILKNKKLGIKDEKHLRQYVEKNGEKALGQFIGIDTPVQDTSNGVAVTAETNGVENASAVVTDETSAQHQAANYADQFPKAAKRLTTTDEIAAERMQHTREVEEVTPTQKRFNEWQVTNPNGTVDEFKQILQGESEKEFLNKNTDFAAFLTETGLPNNQASIDEFNLANRASVEGANKQNQLDAAQVQSGGKQATVSGRSKMVGTPASALTNEPTEEGFSLEVDVTGKTESQVVDELSGMISSRLNIPYQAARGILQKAGIVTESSNKPISKEYLTALSKARQAMHLKVSSKHAADFKITGAKYAQKESEYKAAMQRLIDENKDGLYNPDDLITKAQQEVGLLGKNEGDKQLLQNRNDLIDWLVTKGYGDEDEVRKQFGADTQKLGVLDTAWLVMLGQFLGERGNKDEVNKLIRHDMQADIEKYQSLGNASKIYKKLDEERKQFSTPGIGEFAESAKTVARYVAKIPATLMEVGAIAVDANPIEIGYQLINGEESGLRKVFMNAAKDYRQVVDKDLALARNEAYRNDYLTNQFSEGVAQLATQMILAPLTGGASLLLPVAEGGTAQYREADEAGASKEVRLFAATVGAGLAVPEVLLKAKYLGALTGKTRLAFLEKLTGSLFSKFSKFFGEQEARELTRVTVGSIAKSVVKNSPIGLVGESGQEYVEDIGNKTLKSLTYDPSITWKDIFVPTKEERKGYFTAGLMGLAGANVETVIEKMSDAELMRGQEELGKLLASKRISDTHYQLWFNGVKREQEIRQKRGKYFAKDAEIQKDVSAPTTQVADTSIKVENAAIPSAATTITDAEPVYKGKDVAKAELPLVSPEENAAKVEEAKRQASTVTINGSGESAASQEAINRAASEKAQQITRVAVDTRSGKERPLIGADAVDYQPQPFESVEFRGGDRNGEVIAQGDRVSPAYAAPSRIEPVKEASLAETGKDTQPASETQDESETKRAWRLERAQETSALKELGYSEEQIAALNQNDKADIIHQREKPRPTVTESPLDRIERRFAENEKRGRLNLHREVHGAAKYNSDKVEVTVGQSFGRDRFSVNLSLPDSTSNTGFRQNPDAHKSFATVGEAYDYANELINRHDPAAEAEKAGEAQADVAGETRKARPRGMRVATAEGQQLVEGAQRQLRDVINNKDLAGKQRADAIANGKNLVQFLQANQNTNRPLETDYFGGNKIAYTGENAPDGFRDFIYLEGHKAGEHGVKRTEESRADDVIKEQQRHQEFQAGMKRVREGQSLPAAVATQQAEPTPLAMKGEVAPVRGVTTGVRRKVVGAGDAATTTEKQTSSTPILDANAQKVPPQSRIKMFQGASGEVTDVFVAPEIKAEYQTIRKLRVALKLIGQVHQGQEVDMRHLSHQQILDYADTLDLDQVKNQRYKGQRAKLTLTEPFGRNPKVHDGIVLNRSKAGVEIKTDDGQYLSGKNYKLYTPDTSGETFQHLRQETEPMAAAVNQDVRVNLENAEYTADGSAITYRNTDAYGLTVQILEEALPNSKHNSFGVMLYGDQVQKVRDTIADLRKEFDADKEYYSKKVRAALSNFAKTFDKAAASSKAEFGMESVIFAMDDRALAEERTHQARVATVDAAANTVRATQSDEFWNEFDTDPFLKTIDKKLASTYRDKYLRRAEIIDKMMVGEFDALGLDPVKDANEIYRVLEMWHDDTVKKFGKFNARRYEKINEVTNYWLGRGLAAEGAIQAETQSQADGKAADSGVRDDRTTQEVSADAEAKGTATDAPVKNAGIGFDTPKQAKIKNRKFAETIAHNLMDIGDVPYETNTFIKATNDAFDLIEKKGIDGAIEKFRSMGNGEETFGNKTATAAAIMTDLYNEGSQKDLIEFGVEATKHVGTAAQELVMAKLMSRFSPVFASMHADGITLKKFGRMQSPQERDRTDNLAEKLKDTSDNLAVTRATIDVSEANAQQFEELERDYENLLKKEEQRRGDLETALSAAQEAIEYYKTLSENKPVKTTAARRKMRAEIVAEMPALLNTVKQAFKSTTFQMPAARETEESDAATEALIKLGAVKLIDGLPKKLTLKQFDEYLDGLTDNGLTQAQKNYIHAKAFKSIQTASPLSQEGRLILHNRMAHAQRAKLTIPKHDKTDQRAVQKEKIKSGEAYRDDQFAKTMLDTADVLNASDEAVLMAFGLRETPNLHTLRQIYKQAVPQGGNFDQALKDGRSIYEATKDLIQTARDESKYGKDTSKDEVVRMKRHEKDMRTAERLAQKELEHHFNKLNRSILSKVGHGVSDVWNITRAFLFSLDSGFMLAQGALPLVMNTKAWARSIKGITPAFEMPALKRWLGDGGIKTPAFLGQKYGSQQIISGAGLLKPGQGVTGALREFMPSIDRFLARRGFTNESFETAITKYYDSEIRKELESHGTKFEVIGNIADFNENFMSDIAKKFPGVRQTNLAHSLATDLMRLNIGKQIFGEVDDMYNRGKLTAFQANAAKDALARKWINVITGKGYTPGAWHDIFRWLAQIGSAPSLALSSAQFLHYTLPISPRLYTLPKGARKIVAKGALRSYGILGGILLTLGMLGLINRDPEDKDFGVIDMGKISPKLADQKLNIMRQLKEPVRLSLGLTLKKLYYMATGNKEGSARINDEWYEELVMNDFGGIGSFWKGKAHPSISYLNTLFTGKNFVGEPATTLDYIPVVPLGVKETVQSATYNKKENILKSGKAGQLDDNWSRMIASIVFNGIGWSANSYAGADTTTSQKQIVSMMTEDDRTEEEKAISRKANQYERLIREGFAKNDIEQDMTADLKAGNLDAESVKKLWAVYEDEMGNFQTKYKVWNLTDEQKRILMANRRAFKILDYVWGGEPYKMDWRKVDAALKFANAKENTLNDRAAQAIAEGIILEALLKSPKMSKQPDSPEIKALRDEHKALPPYEKQTPAQRKRAEELVEQINKLMKPKQ